MLPIFGIGKVPAIIALTLYALLPILRNTYTGILGVDPALVDAGRGMGMTSRQILFMVELPLTLPIIMAGVRTATVLTIGVAALATFIGAGGLGDLIDRGLRVADKNLILIGAIPAAILAILFDLFLRKLEEKVTPRGLKS
jgi:osmoprotectant transport system permease protein